MNPEDIITIDLATYTKMQYPEVIFTHVANERKTKTSTNSKGRNFSYEGNLLKKKGVRRGVSDMLYFEPRGIYHGLFIEIKVDSPFKRNGELKAGNVRKKSSLHSYLNGESVEKSHLEIQHEFIQKMNERGYYACFAVGYEQCQEILDKYLALRPKETLD